MESSGLAERIFIGISFGIEFVISVLFGLLKYFTYFYIKYEIPFEGISCESYENI